MSTTNAHELLERADRCIRDLRDTDVPTASERWDSFDDTVYRLLSELIGLDAQHVRTADPSRQALAAAIRSYPTPLRPPVDTWLRPNQVARYENRSRDAVLRAHRGSLHVIKDADAELIHSRHVEAQSRVRPADPADPHPLAKAATTLGVLADLLYEARTDHTAVLERNGEVAGAVQHVMTLASVAARHTLAYGDLDDALRPLVVGRYAERTVDSLRQTSIEPTGLRNVARVAMEAVPADLNEALEAAIHTWDEVSNGELSSSVPSVEVLRQVANQGIHIVDAWSAVDQMPEATHHLAGVTRKSLAHAQDAWEALTTLSRPSHEFVTASRSLFVALSQIQAPPPCADPADKDRATADLLRGLRSVNLLFLTTAHLPQRLVDAGVVYAPAKRLRVSDDRLEARSRGRYAPVRQGDVPDLTHAWATAGDSCSRLVRQLDAPDRFTNARYPAL